MHMRIERSSVTVLTLAFLAAASIARADDAGFTRTEDVIYGRKHGVALTLDVFKPKEKANGAAVVFVVSGGWFSSHAAINAAFMQPFLKRGYTCFAVVHGSQPRFAIPEILEDMHRAVRFVRHNAKTYGIDPNRIGISGASAGGHLSLMQGTAGNAGNPDAGDPVDRESSRVQAVGCFFPPTDFLNYGEEGVVALGRGPLKNFKAPFNFTKYESKTNEFVRVTDEEEFRKIGRHISPVYHASEDDPPTLIIHGDADKLVPIQQAELMMKSLEKAGVETKLVVKKDASHGWPKMLEDVETVADWFDKQLQPGEKAEAAETP